MTKKITRRELLRGLGALGVATLLGCSRRGETPSPSATPDDTAGGDALPSPLPDADSSRLSWNFITVMCDTLRYDHLGFFGNTAIQTPNIDDFAGRSLVFDRAYAGGFPTLLNRVDLFTGRCSFTYMGWKDLDKNDIVLADVMNDAGYRTAIIFDTWHLKEEGRTYDRGFGTSQWIRGQEGDPYRRTPLWPALPAERDKLRHPDMVRQYMRNVSRRQGEEDYFVAQTMRAAIAWLRENHDQGRFLLHIDSFDPHEPWDPPQSYVDRYDPGYQGQEIIYPAYAPADYLTADELDHVQALYAAEVTLVDRWLGELFAEIERCQLWDDTVVMLMSDHGIMLGEHGVIGKAWDHEGVYECYPLYEEMIHIPLMMHIPGMGHRRISDLVQPADLMPTILELAGAADPGTMHGVSLVPVIEDLAGGEHTPPHEVVVSSRALDIPLSRNPLSTITDGDWTLFFGGERSPSELYYLPDDPQQRTNLIDEACDVARSFHAWYVALLEELEVNENRLSPWRTPPC